MRTRVHSSRVSGIAMIIVMLVIVVLSVLAGGFAYTMKVETRLAANNAYESDMEWLGRSGVELARYVLGQEMSIPEEARYTGLNQFWASGFAGTNEVFADIDLKNNTLSSGRFSIEIKDMERRFNLSMINEANIMVLEKALQMSGVDSADISALLDCYLDWTDPDEQKRVHGAESRDYLKDPARPHYAKNGPPDDIAELTMIKGFSPSLVFRNPRSAALAGGARAAMDSDVERAGGPALEDLFSTIGGTGMAVNVNTASAAVLQLVPGIDQELAQAIVSTRAGPDGTDATEDDIPFLNVGELQNVPGFDPGLLPVISRFLAVQSMIFEVTVNAQIGSSKRTYKALVHRRSRAEVVILFFSWK